MQSDRVNDKEQVVDALLAVMGVSLGDNEEEKIRQYSYAIDGDLSEADVRALLNSKIPKKEIEDIKLKINSIEDKELKKYLMAELNADAYKARITRLEALKKNIKVNMYKVADTELKLSSRGYMNTIKDAYYKNIFDIQKGIGIGFDFSPLPDKKIQEILKNNWSGKNYSKRIWCNAEVMTDKLQETLTSGLMSGKSYKKMAADMADMSKYGMFAAERLIRTETTYVANMGEMQSYEECGIDKYIFVATLDSRTSEICQEHDGNIYKVSDTEPGENLPPLHPYCRSTTIAYMGEEWLNGIKRRARDPETGKTYTVPGNMNYNEWYQKNVVGKYGEQKAETFQNMIKNKASDRKQYAKYKEILGKNAPGSLKGFQELKYNNSEEWGLMKGYYQGITKGSLTPLADFKLYKDIDKQIRDNLTGITTKGGITIRSHSIHFIERVIGSAEQRRSGVKIKDIKDALINLELSIKV